jgi:hypothetical protein
LIALRASGLSIQPVSVFPLHFDHVRAKATDDMTMTGRASVATQKETQETASSS